MSANRNANNSNNKDTMDAPIQKHGSVDDLGEIRPEVTPEGYGLRTPYGTHLNLDFLQYCQNIADGQTYHGTSPSNSRRMSSGSSKGSSNTSTLNSSKSSSTENSKDNENENESSNSKQDVERNLWETRRRLDAFRSYRKKSSSALDKQQYIGRFNRLSPKTFINNGPKDLSNECESTETPVLTNLLNVPVPQQNLQAVREQMATALSRLKYLESEVKQVPVLQVQISVLQQEKQKLNAELKKYKEDSQVNGHEKSTKENYATLQHSNSSHSSPRPTSLESPTSSPHGSTSLPPPPPRRKYKSIAVGPDVVYKESVNRNWRKERTDELLKRLGQSPVKSDEFIPTTTYKDVCIGISPDYATQHTSTEAIELCNVNTSSHDLVSTVSISCGNHVVTSDVQCQYERLYPLKDRGADAPPQKVLIDASSQSLQKRFADKSVITDNDFVIKYPGQCVDVGVGDGLVIEEKVLCVDTAVSAQPEINHQGVNTTRVTCVETATSCKVDVTDIACHVNIRPETESISVATMSTLKSYAGTMTDNFEPEVSDQSTGIEVVSQSDKSCLCLPDATDFGCNVVIKPEVLDQGTGTESVLRSDKSCLFQPDATDFACNVVIKPEVLDQSTGTEQVSQSEKSCLSRPDATDFGCNVTFKPEVAVVATSTDSKVLADVMVNTNAVLLESVLLQHSPFTSDAACEANILPLRAEASTSVEIESPKVLPNKTDFGVQISISEPELRISKSDAATDTGDIDEAQPLRNIQSEIGSYVGQVESLLEEQQSLLADKYKELEGVLDEKNKEQSSVPPVTNDKSNADIPPPAEKHEPEADQISPIKDSEVFDVLKKNGYKLTEELRSACVDVDEHIKHPTELSSAFMENSLFKLQQEWFNVAAMKTSRPDFIKDFAAEVRNISSDVLRKIVNATDSTGNSALHYAVSHENFALVYTLAADVVELDVDGYNNAGYTASMLAAITRIQTEFEVQAVATLFSRADVSLHARQAGQTALMLAVSHGCIPATKLLLKAGADINAQDEDGSTALMCATEHGQIEVVKLLLAHPSCDPTITDNDGSAAINIAMERGQRDIAVLLYVQIKLE